MKTVLALTWQDFDEAVTALAEQLREITPNNAIIVAQRRGGWPLAVALSHHLGLKVYDADYAPPAGRVPVLWVDDILDSGITYLAAVARFPLLTPVVLVNKQPHIYPTVRFALTCERDAWVQFPWEPAPNIDADRAAYEASRR